MSFVLEVDTAAWRAHLKSYVASAPEVVPVIKGNGYGFGRLRLYAAAADLGLDTISVGTYAEAVEALEFGAFETISVLQPWRPSPGAGGSQPALNDPHLLHSVSRVVDVTALSSARRDRPPLRVAVEVLTSMRRHGIRAEDVTALAAQLALAPGLAVEAAALHLPIDRPRDADPAGEVSAWHSRLTAAGVPVGATFASHLTAAELATLAAELSPGRLRPRVGTALWLGAAHATQARAQVTDVHSVRRGDRSGYRQRRVPADGSVIVVSGGTSNGIGLDAVSAPRGTARVRRLAVAGLEALGPRLSPFRWRGSQRWYAEPPQMQLSTLFLPATVVPPAVGDWLDVDCRKTTTTFDEVVFH